MLKFCLRLHAFSIPNQNGSAISANEIEGQYFVMFLANILILRLIFKRNLAPSGNGEETYSWHDLVEDDFVSP